MSIAERGKPVVLPQQTSSPLEYLASEMTEAEILDDFPDRIASRKKHPEMSIVASAKNILKFSPIVGTGPPGEITMGY